MAFQPVVGNLVLFAFFQKRGPQVRVQGGGLVGFFPAAGAPPLGPAFFQPVDDILAVAVQIDGAGLFQLAQGFQQGGHLHAVVGGVGLAAGKLLLVHFLCGTEPQNGPPAAGAGVAAARAVGINFNLFHS